MFSQNSTIAPFLQYIFFFMILAFSLLGIYYLIYIGNKHVDEHRKLRFNWKRIGQLVVLSILFTIIAALFRRYEVLGNTTFAIFLSVLLAFILNPLVNKFESYGIKRGLGTIITYGIIVAVLVFLGIAIIPDLITQATNFFSNLPESIQQLVNALDKQLTDWNIDSNLLNEARNNINSSIAKITQNIPGWGQSFWTTIRGSISSLVTIVLVPIITFYFIVDKRKIITGLYNLVPRSYKNDTYYLYKEINFAMKEFLISRSLMALFIGVATGIMLSLFGIPFALVIGILTTLMDIVPYVGPVIATAPALIFAFLKSPVTFVWVAFFCWFLQWIEQNILGPKLFSSSSGLHEVLILISIIVGGGIFGVWGMILAVPAVVIVKILFGFIFMKLKGIQPKYDESKEQKENKPSAMAQFFKRNK